MNCIINRKLFLNELAWIKKFVEKKSTIPILCNILIESTGSKLMLTATDLELGATTEVELEEAGPTFRTTIPIENLIKLMKAKVDEVYISPLTNDQPGLRITLGAGSSVIYGMSPETFPEIPWPSTLRESAFVPSAKAEHKETDTPEEIAKYEAAYEKTLAQTFAAFTAARTYGTFEITGLPSAVDKVITAISQEESRFTMNGALFENKGKQSILVATDGHRLHLAQVRASRPPVCDWNVTKTNGTPTSEPAPVTRIVIPKKALAQAAAIYTDDYVNVYVNENHVCFRQRDSDRIILARKLTGNFPDYERVLPSAENLQTVEVNPAQLIECLTQIQPFADERSHAIRFDIEHAELSVWAETSERGKGSAKLALPTNGVEFHTGYNYTYMLDALSEYKKEPVMLFSFNRPDSAALFSSVSGDAKFLLMPMRI